MTPSAEPKARVVICDDAPTIRMLVSELLAPHYECLATCSGEETLEKAPGFAPNVIVTDLLMEGMDGLELCKAIKAHPQLKRVPVVLLTTKSDSDSRAIGLESGADDYLFKPLQERELLARVASLVRLHRAITAEAALLAQTLGGSVKMLCDLLALINPAVFGRSIRARQLAAQFAQHLQLEERWALEVAAMLSQIGYVTLPPATVDKVFRGLLLNEKEREMVARLPVITEELLANIPRLEPVREVLLNQLLPFDGPQGKREALPIAARVLRVVLDYDALESAGMSPEKAFECLRSESSCYDPALLRVLAELRGLRAKQHQERDVTLSELRPGMVLSEDVFDAGGALLIARGQEVAPGTVELLTNLASTVGVRQPIRVRLPPEPPAA
ncbi:MAG: response regulator [Deltaproteobacteria bacterium]|nr:response regulator [Deltaproteobacteria bacterium]